MVGFFSLKLMNMEAKEEHRHKLFSLKLVKRVIITFIAIFVFDFFLFPMPALASEYSEDMDNGVEIIYVNENAEMIINNTLPENNDWEVKSTSYHSVTAYNSEVSQCDGDPCTTANGFNLCEHGIEDSVAANFLPFGAKIRIPDLFDDRIFVVRDRMNSRYPDYIDVWMLSKAEARKLGVKIAKIEILEH